MSSLPVEVAPVKPKVRIQALDVIRGVSILGILAVNADGFAGPMAASLNPANWLYPNQGWTAFSYWVMDAFFHEKFVTLFSMLFGVSLFLVGGERADKRKSRILFRRLVVLLLFAMLHGFGIWWGDILSLYAVTGFIMFFCRSWRPRTLMIVGVVLLGITVVQELPPQPFHAVASFVAGPVAAQPGITDGADSIAHKAKIASDLAQMKGSWAGAYSQNAANYIHLLKGDRSLIPSTLALMMIGLSLFKTGFMTGKSSKRRYGIVVAIGSVALAIIGWLTWQVDVMETPIPLADFLQHLLTPFASLAYASVLMLILKGGFPAVLSPVAAAGRMAFTNYLTQSLIMTSIFYGGRGGWMGDIDRPGLWCMVIGIWALQLVWSPWWMSRFEMGPFEWAWRCLTYGHRVPLRKPA